MLDFMYYPDALEVMLVTTLFGFYLSLLGVPLILKKQAFNGAALSQTAALGGVLGTLLHLPDYILPFIFVLGALVLLVLRQSQRTPEDGPTAILFINMTAFGTLLISKLPTGEADLMSVNFGNILALSSGEITAGIIISLIGIVVFMIIYRPLLVVINDQATAEALGINPKLILGIYSILLTAGITFGLVVFGVIVVFAFLVAPAFLALRISGSNKGWIIFNLIIVFISGIAGLWLSFGLDFPPGPFIAGLLGLSAFVGWLIKK